MRSTLILLGLPGMLAVTARAQQSVVDADREGAALCEAYLARFKPLILESSVAWWEANITGTDAAFARKKASDDALVDLHADRDFFARVKGLKEKGGVTDPVLRRQLDLLYRAFLAGQADPHLQKRVVDLQNDIEQTFNTYRAQVGDKPLHENDVREILATTTDSTQAEAVWKAYMDVGAKVAGKLREIVRLRNQMARQLGFRDYYALSLALQEVDEQELFKLFDELDALARAPFAKLKADIDAARAKRFGIAVPELRPWHFGDLFFQEAPGGLGMDLDEAYKGADPLELSQKYYASIGLPVDDILARSDLYEKPGKCPQGYGVDMDRAGDVRVIANLKPNLYWTSTLLHEVAHAAYYKYIRPDVPFLLRDSAHAITTEGVAQMFGALGGAPGRAQGRGRAAREALRAERLIFSRWAQVMVRFEHSLYSDPDQDLVKTWCELRQRYQLLNPPGSLARPDYAAKFHLITNPVYYHSYMMGELFAAQVRHHLVREVLKHSDPQETACCGRPEAGAYLRDKIFGPGNLYSWNELTQSATGEPLTPKYFAKDLAEGQ
jgi:peptidyl-dipeptidase A